MAEIELGIPGLADYKEIASGGFATVYSAFEPDAGRRVAVKVLRSVDENGRRRFDRERHTMGQTTDHVNIVTMFRSGYTDPGNHPYLVMEHLSGGSLQDRLDNDGPMRIDDAVDVVLSIADGLGFAHTTGIVHKDVKPANILISGTGVAKLTDFGISAVRDATGTAHMAFSLAYTAPETFAAVRGPDGDVIDERDERSDLYSLAATFYALVTGSPPFHATSQATLIHQILTEAADPIDGDGLDAFFAVALAKNPDSRFPTAAQFIHAAQALATADPHQPGHSPTPDPEPAPNGGSVPVTVKAGSAQRPRPEVQNSEGAALVDPPPPRPGFDQLRQLGLAGPWLWVGAVAVTVAVAFVTIGLLFLLGRSDPESAASTMTGSSSTTVVGEVEIAWDLPISHTGHTDWVESVVELNDGLIASASSDETVQIWDPANPTTTIATYRGHTDGLRSVIQLDDGLIASAGWDETVQIWDPANPNTTIASYRGHTSGVNAVTQLDDGLIASAGSDETVQIWDPANPNTTIASYRGHTSGVNAVTQLDDGLIASAGRDETVQIWDPADPDITIATYTGHTWLVTSLTQLDDGLIASASGDNTVQVWDPADPDTTIATYTGHSQNVTSVMQLDNGLVVSAGLDHTVQIWNPTDP